ncbi:MAG: hypothetical protein K2U26_12095 [Cyclobacteriaceae bacterium]|nr:hypothetical protein [Cyclobacteriaceae bacterium]
MKNSDSSCKKSTSPGESIPDQQLKKISKTWKVTSVTLGGTQQTNYTNFQLTASGTAGSTTFGYSTTGRPALSPWPASGTFTFGTDPATQLTRDDGLPVTYIVSETQLQLTFNYTGRGIGGRVGNVEGNWIMNFGL